MVRNSSKTPCFKQDELINILDAMEVGVYIVSPQYEIQYVNPELIRQLGPVERQKCYEYLHDRKEPCLDCKNDDIFLKGKTTNWERYDNLGKTYEVLDTPFAKRGGRIISKLVVFRDITEQEQLRKNMQLYINEVSRAQEEERKRIARELHDGIAQSLSSLCVNTEEIMVMRKQLPVETIGQLEELKVKIQCTLEEVRQFSHKLRPALLDQFGLIPSIELLLEQVRCNGELDCRLEVTGYERRLPSDTELALFRIAQEAINNIKKHAQAKKSVIKFKFTNGKIAITITDNGRGFKVPEMLSNFARAGKLGLVGMKERVRLLSGEFLLESQVGKGTIVKVEVQG